MADFSKPPTRTILHLHRLPNDRAFYIRIRLAFYPSIQHIYIYIYILLYTCNLEDRQQLSIYFTYLFYYQRHRHSNSTIIVHVILYCTRVTTPFYLSHKEQGRRISKSLWYGMYGMVWLWGKNLSLSVPNLPWVSD